MEMKPNKTLLGIFTFLPFIAAIIIGIWAFSIAVQIISEQALGNELSEEEVLSIVMTDFVSLMIISMALGLLSLGLTIYYIVHVINNKRIETGMKILWVILIFLFSGIAKLIYFFAVIVPTDYDKPLPEENVTMV